jgi:hypothetical protein
MGLIDRAFGADKHTLANYRLSIHWKAAKQRFEEHKQECQSKEDIAICNKLIVLCDDVMKEIVIAKKGFGVFPYDERAFSSYMDQVAELVGNLENKSGIPVKVAELFLETTNILNRKYR